MQHFLFLTHFSQKNMINPDGYLMLKFILSHAFLSTTSSAHLLLPSFFHASFADFSTHLQMPGFLGDLSLSLLFLQLPLILAHLSLASIILYPNVGTL